MTPEQQTPASVEPKTFKTNDPTNPLHRLAGDLQCGRLKVQGVAEDVTYALALIERLLAEREGLREALEEVLVGVEKIARIHEQPDLETAHDAKEWAHCAAIVVMCGPKVTVARAALTQGESRQTGVCICVARGDGPRGMRHLQRNRKAPPCRPRPSKVGQ